MIVPILIIALTVVVVLFVHLTNNISLWDVRDRLKEEIRLRQINSFILKRAWPLRALKDPQLIFEESDTPEIHTLKQEFLDKWSKARRALKTEIIIAIIGLVSSFLAVWLVYYLKGKS